MSAAREVSQLLPGVLERLGLQRRFTVFDAGSATPDTVAFFSEYKCRLHFADLYEDAIIVEQDQLEDAELQARFDELLAFAVESFDLCLLWDAPNYLNPRARNAFGNALRPFIHRGTLAHGYCAFKETQPFTPQQYSIHAADTLAVLPRPDALAPRHPVTQNGLVTALPFFAVARGTLMSDGRVELFLEVA